MSECRSVELVRLLKERKCDVRYTAITGTDHNSILSKTENLKKIMASLVGDEDTWVSEIVRSLSVDPTQCMRKTHTVNEIDVSML